MFGFLKSAFIIKRAIATCFEPFLSGRVYLPGALLYLLDPWCPFCPRLYCTGSRAVYCYFGPPGNIVSYTCICWGGGTFLTQINVQSLILSNNDRIREYFPKRTCWRIHRIYQYMLISILHDLGVGFLWLT